MFAVEDIASKTGAKSRKIHEIAGVMGYPKADSYPEEVLHEASLQMSAARRKKSHSVEEAHQAASDATADAPRVGDRRTNEDLKEVDQLAQTRAAGKLIALEILTTQYELTEEFTDPDLKAQLEEVRHKCQEVRGGFNNNYSVKGFLSPTRRSAISLIGIAGSRQLSASSGNFPDEQPSPDDDGSSTSPSAA